MRSYNTAGISYIWSTPRSGGTLCNARSSACRGPLRNTSGRLPNIGQHTVHVCQEILGMSEDDINALIEADVLEVGLPEESTTP